MHIIKVCTGSYCSQQYADSLIRAGEETLGIKVGETTDDGQFRLEKTGCLSHCELAPNVMFCKADGPLAAVMLDGKVENTISPKRFKEELKSLQENS